MRVCLVGARKTKRNIHSLKLDETTISGTSQQLTATRVQFHVHRCPMELLQNPRAFEVRDPEEHALRPIALHSSQSVHACSLPRNGCVYSFDVRVRWFLFYFFQLAVETTVPDHWCRGCSRPRVVIRFCLWEDSARYQISCFGTLPCFVRFWSLGSCG